jgi:excisionase family DNA binding protein
MSTSKAKSRVQLLEAEGDLGVRWWTPGQIAKRLGVSSRMVQNWIDSGRLVGMRLPGSRDRRVHPSALEQFERENGFDAARGKR